MKTYFTTGKFAKLANVTERTIRYYDSEGLLKPSFIMENGYRKYSEEDFVELQRIISLKQLGFSLDEIKTMHTSQDKEAIQESLQLQIDLLDRRVRQTQSLKDALRRTQKLLLHEEDHFDWNKIVELIQLSMQEEKIIEHYHNAHNLSVRIQLHDRFSTNKQGWFPWLFSNIDFTGINRLLEVGCGSGDLWQNQNVDTRNREIFLSDISDGMIENARENLGDAYSYMTIDIQQIPFKNEYFDAVIANHVLFYVNDLAAGLHEVYRVLKGNGRFYCSAYGKNHMKEITALVKEFDETITLSQQTLYDNFGLDEGEESLAKYFQKVEKRMYSDELIIDEVQPLYDYIMSCHGNQIERLSPRTDEFKRFLETKLNEHGAIHITKNAGLFICTKELI